MVLGVQYMSNWLHHIYLRTDPSNANILSIHPTIVVLSVIKSFTIIVLLYLSLTNVIIMMIMEIHHNAPLLFIRKYYQCTLYYVFLSIITLFSFVVYWIAIEYGNKYPKGRKLESNKNTSLSRVDAAQVTSHTPLTASNKLSSIISSVIDTPAYSRHPNYVAHIHYRKTLIESVIIVILMFFLLLFYHIDTLYLIMDNMINMISTLFFGHLIMIINDNIHTIRAKYSLNKAATAVHNAA